MSTSNDSITQSDLLVTSRGRLWQAGKGSSSLPLSKAWWEDVARAIPNRPSEVTLDHAPTIAQISSSATTRRVPEPQLAVIDAGSESYGGHRRER